MHADSLKTNRIHKNHLKKQRYFRLKFPVVLEEFSKIIKSSFIESRPDKVSIELGFELSVESGALTALLVKGTSKANITVNLEWTFKND
mgnify:CR=1 FL=1